MSLNTIADFQTTDDDIIVRNRDKKSHSKTYLKQVQKRDQSLADAINRLPNKLKKKLATDMPSSTATQQPETRRANKRRDTYPTFQMLTAYSDDQLARQDAMAEMQDEEALMEEENRLAQIEAKDAEYRRLVDQWQGEVQTKRDLEFQIYFQKKTQYNEGSGSVEDMRKIRDAIILYEMQHNIRSTQYSGSESDSEVETTPENDDCDESSVDEHMFMAHQNNLAALTRYYENIAINPSVVDAEYEFWLTFEIRSFEEGCRDDIVDVDKKMADDDEEKEDADDRLQQYIEDRAEDAMDDNY
jgi:hypothetical protein